MSSTSDKIADVIAAAPDSALFEGLCRRGVYSTKKLADGTTRLIVKVKVEKPAAKQQRRRRKAFDLSTVREYV